MIVEAVREWLDRRAARRFAAAGALAPTLGITLTLHSEVVGGEVVYFLTVSRDGFDPTQIRSTGKRRCMALGARAIWRIAEQRQHALFLNAEVEAELKAERSGAGR